MLIKSHPNLPNNARTIRPDSAFSEPPQPPQDEVSFGRKAARFTGSALGGLVGGVAGLPLGGVRGALSANYNPGSGLVSTARVTGAIAVTGLGLAASLTGHGSLIGVSPLVASVISVAAGPIVGAALGQATVGVASGLMAGVHGACEGVHDGAVSGAQSGRNLVDWMAGDSKSK